MQYIAFDAHKNYTLASVEDQMGRVLQDTRVNHRRGAFCDFLAECEPGSPVAVEAMGSGYWIVDEIERAGMTPHLVHPRKAKLMLGAINKTDKLDVRGINRLQRTGTLPTVWIPTAQLRDQRDLPRTRMVFTRHRTRLKNRVHATLAKYAVPTPDVSDLFGREGRRQLAQLLTHLPPHTRFATELLLIQLDLVQAQIADLEQQMRQTFAATDDLRLLETIPGIGFVVGIVVLLEVGDIQRFPNGEHLAAYAGLTPRVSASAGRIRFGRLRPDVNRYLKWAFIESANAISLNRRRWPTRHVTQVYARIEQRKGHDKAIGAVARHLAEATYWILHKHEPYREPHSRPVPSTKA